MSSEVLYRSGGSALVRVGNVLVQVRCAAGSEEAIARLEQAVLSMRAAARGGHVGALAVIEPSAELLAPALRERQKKVFDSLLQDPATFGVLVVEGEGIKAGLFRTLARAIGRGTARLKIVATADEGIRSLLQSVESSDREGVERALADARAIAHGAR